MSSLVHSAQQQNTLSVYRSLPLNCIAVNVMDRHSLPFIKPGEVVVVDTEDRTPRVGDIYVIEWSGGRRNVCQARHSAGPWQRKGQDVRWHVGSVRTITPAEFEDWLTSTDEATAKAWCLNGSEDGRKARSPLII